MSRFEDLLNQLKTGTWEDRKLACEQLIAFGNPEAVHPLIIALDDQDAGVRKAAFIALGKLNHPLAAGPMVEHLEAEKEEPVRLAAIVALGKLRSPKAVYPLAALLRDRNDSIRLAAIESLGAIRDVRAVNDLLGCLADRNLHVRAAACEALGLLKHSIAVGPLIEMLGDVEPVVREKSLGALRRLGQHALVTAYTRALYAASLDAADLRSLARRGDVRLVSALVNRLVNPMNRNEGRDRLMDALKSVFEASMASLDRMFCTEHLSRFSVQKRDLDNAGKIQFVGCRTCGATFYGISASTVVAVLDENMRIYLQHEQDVIRVNWLSGRSLFDFNKVEIGAADDKTVTQFCLSIRNDTDPGRPTRWDEMPCDVLPSARINENTVQILKRTFKTVRVL